MQFFATIFDGMIYLFESCCPMILDLEQIENLQKVAKKEPTGIDKKLKEIVEKDERRDVT